MTDRKHDNFCYNDLENTRPPQSSLMRQLAKLQLRDDKAIHQYFIRAHQLFTCLHYAGEEHSETLFNAMVFNSLPNHTSIFGAGQLQYCGQFCETEEASHQLRVKPQTEMMCGSISTFHNSKECFSRNWYTLFIQITS